MHENSNHFVGKKISLENTMTFNANCLHRGQFALNVKLYFVGKIRRNIINLSFAEFVRVVKYNLPLRGFVKTSY